MRIVPERVKSAYRRHRPARPVRDATGRNYRMMEQRGPRLLSLLLLALLFTIIAESAC